MDLLKVQDFKRYEYSDDLQRYWYEQNPELLLSHPPAVIRTVDLSETLDEVRSRSSAARSLFNYRLGYRTSVATRGLSERMFYGSTLVSKPVSDVNPFHEAVDPETEFFELAPDYFDDTHLNDFERAVLRMNCSAGTVFASAVDVDFFALEAFVFNQYFIPPSSSVLPNKMSRRTKNKVQDKIISFYRASAGRHFFLTLSFISRCTDQKGVSVLNTFLTNIRKEHGLINYVWVAERQTGERSGTSGTGNVHFHLVLDKRFDIDYINALWVLVQFNSGITHPSLSLSEVRRIFNSRQYKLIQKHLNPADVKKVRGVNGVASYLTKYISKNESSMFCRLWHCSRSVSRLATSYNCGANLFRATCDTSRNYYHCRKTGKKVGVVPFNVVQTKKASNGSRPSTVCSSPYDVAIVVRILNPKNFVEHLTVLERLNRLILKNPDKKSWSFFHSNTVSPELQTLLQ